MPTIHHGCSNSAIPGQLQAGRPAQTHALKGKKNNTEKALGRIINGLFPPPFPPPFVFVFFFFLFVWLVFLIEGIRPSWHKVTFPTVIPARQQNCCLDRSQSLLLPLQLRTQSQPPGHAERRGRRAAHLPAHLSLWQSPCPLPPPGNKPTEK